MSLKNLQSIMTNEAKLQTTVDKNVKSQDLFMKGGKLKTKLEAKETSVLESAFDKLIEGDGTDEVEDVLASIKEDETFDSWLGEDEAGAEEGADEEEKPEDEEEHAEPDGDEEADEEEGLVGEDDEAAEEAAEDEEEKPAKAKAPKAKAPVAEEEGVVGEDDEAAEEEGKKKECDMTPNEQMSVAESIIAQLMLTDASELLGESEPMDAELGEGDADAEDEGEEEKAEDEGEEASMGEGDADAEEDAEEEDAEEESAE